MKEARKVALIDLEDYPREKYSAYWEIHVDEHSGGFQWSVRVYELAGGLLAKMDGLTPTRDEADTAAQTWAKSEMENHKWPR